MSLADVAMSSLDDDAETIGEVCSVVNSLCHLRLASRFKPTSILVPTVGMSSRLRQAYVAAGSAHPELVRYPRV